MATKIKGITVEIGGDTTKLGKSIKEVNKELSTTQSDLKQVDRLLKLDPGNVTLLTQKQEGLNKSIQNTSKKLDILKTVAEQAKKKLDIGEISADQYNDLTRKVIETTQSLKSLEGQAAETAKKLGPVKIPLEEIGGTAQTVSEKTKRLSIGIAGIKAAAVAAIPATEEYRDAMGKLEVNIENSAASIDNAQGSFKQFFELTGEMDSSVEGLSNLLAAGFNDEQLTTAVNNLSGAVVAFPDTLKIESLADSLQETIATGQATGQFAELLGRAGMSVDEFNGHLEKAPTLLDKQNIALDYLANTGLAQTYEAWQKENGALIQSRDAHLNMQESMARFSESIIPVVTKVTEMAAAFLNWFSDLSGPGQAAVVTLLALAAAISPMAGLIANVMHIVANADRLLTPLNIKIIAIAASIGLLIALIAGISQAWKSMTGAEKVLAVLGAVAVAAAAAAIAMGAIKGIGGAIAAAAAIVSGVAVATAAISSANSRARASSGGFSMPSGGDGGYAQAPGYGGTYADRRMQTQPQNITMVMDGATVGRVMSPHIDQNRQRTGVDLAGG